MVYDLDGSNEFGVEPLHLGEELCNCEVVIFVLMRDEYSCVIFGKDKEESMGVTVAQTSEVDSCPRT
jgi:hypothetical protein